MQTSEIQFTEEQSLLLDSAVNFCRDKVTMDKVRQQFDSQYGFDSELWQQLIDMGWNSIGIPEQFGGADIALNCAVPVLETTGNYLFSTPLYSSLLFSQMLLRAGSQQQMHLYLPQVVNGSIGTVAILENDDWGKPLPDTELSRESDNRYRLNGRKQLVMDATVADFILVASRMDNQLCWALVETDSIENLKLTPHVLFDPGKRAASIEFDNVKLSRDHLLPLESAAAATRDLMLLGALFTASEAVGSTRGCLNAIVDYLQTRVQFGKKIGSYQALKHPSVDILTGYNDARSLVYGAISSIDSSALSVDTEILCRMAKSCATQVLAYAGDRAVQFHGAMGFTFECDAHLYLRRSQWAQQQFGDDLHHKTRLSRLLLD